MVQLPIKAPHITDQGIRWG